MVYTHLKQRQRVRVIGCKGAVVKIDFNAVYEMVCEMIKCSYRMKTPDWNGSEPLQEVIAYQLGIMAFVNNTRSRTPDAESVIAVLLDYF